MIDRIIDFCAGNRSVVFVTVILAATSWIGLAIFLLGRRRISSLHFVEEAGVAPLV